MNQIFEKTPIDIMTYYIKTELEVRTELSTEDGKTRWVLVKDMSTGVSWRASSETFRLFLANARQDRKLHKPLIDWAMVEPAFDHGLTVYFGGYFLYCRNLWLEMMPVDEHVRKGPHKFLGVRAAYSASG